MPGENLPSAQTPADFRSQGALKTFVFRYGFDSSQARQTVRWGRFQGLLFAPEKRAEHAFGRRMERSAGGWCGKPGACLAADGPLALQTGASFRGIAWAHYLGALLGRSRRARRLGSQPGQTAKRQTARSGATKPCRKPCRARLSLPPAPLQAFVDFATGLIAAKPVKPCDGGVFGAFYLLLKKERNTHAGRL